MYVWRLTPCGDAIQAIITDRDTERMHVGVLRRLLMLPACRFRLQIWQLHTAGAAVQHQTYRTRHDTDLISLELCARSSQACPGGNRTATHAAPGPSTRAHKPTPAAELASPAGQCEPVVPGI